MKKLALFTIMAALMTAGCAQNPQQLNSSTNQQLNNMVNSIHFGFCRMCMDCQNRCRPYWPLVVDNRRVGEYSYGFAVDLRGAQKRKNVRPTDQLSERQYPMAGYRACFVGNIGHRDGGYVSCRILDL